MLEENRFRAVKPATASGGALSLSSTCEPSWSAAASQLRATADNLSESVLTRAGSDPRLPAPYLDALGAGLLQQLDGACVRCLLAAAVVPGQVAASGPARQLVAQLLGGQRVLQGRAAEAEARRRCRKKGEREQAGVSFGQAGAAEGHKSSKTTKSTIDNPLKAPNHILSDSQAATNRWLAGGCGGGQPCQSSLISN